MSLNLSSINLSKFNEMKAIKILQTLFNGGLLPSACTIEGGKYILKDCAASPNLYTIVEGDVLPEKDYLCIRDSYVLPDDAVKVLHSICQQIWKTQQWPQDWKRSVSVRFHPV